MTRDEIIRMAEDCGISHRYYEIPVSKKGVVTVESSTHRLCQFADLIAQQEREACANVCEDLIGTRAMARHCADAIRARGDDDIYDVWVEQELKEKNVPQP